MGLRVKEVIKEKGATVQILADKVGINRVGLFNHINENLSVAILEKTTVALEMSIQELFRKEPNKDINGYTEIGAEIFKITSFQDMKNIINRFNSTK